MDNVTLYNEATKVLDQYKYQKNKFVDCLRKLTILEIELDNVRAMVTKELDDGVVSKTALKDIVSGDKRVMNAKHGMLKFKANKEAIKASMDYLDKVYSLKKKMMDSVSSELKYLGG